MYWSTEFIRGSYDLEVSANATVMMAPAHGSLPTSAEPDGISLLREDRSFAQGMDQVCQVRPDSVRIARRDRFDNLARSDFIEPQSAKADSNGTCCNTECALLKEELDIKDDRRSRLPSRRRPYYTPVQRMRILQLKAARGWSCAQAARAFLINEQTLRSWLERVDEEGERSLIQTAEPVNRFPHFVRYLVQQLGVLLPTMGKIRIAQILARAGLHLGAGTVGRMLKEGEPLSPGDTDLASIEVTTRVVTAKCPGHVWHVDLTTVATSAGLWVPWVPYARPQSWPFCWWVAVVVDHFSRAVVGLT